jgi:hypothetical protein
LGIASRVEASADTAWGGVRGKENRTITQQDIHESDHDNRSEYEVEHRESEDFGLGRWGVRDGGKSGGGGLRSRHWVALPNASLQVREEANRVRQSEVEPGRRLAIRPGSRLGGWAAKSRHSDARVAAGPSAFSAAKRRSRSTPSSAVRRRIFAEAAALMSARRARKAPAAGGLRHT